MAFASGTEYCTGTQPQYARTAAVDSSLRPQSSYTHCCTERNLIQRIWQRTERPEVRIVKVKAAMALTDKAGVRLGPERAA
jgi:hypothetical protein